MATQHFLGTAPAVAQVATVQITGMSGTPSDTTYKITIGGIVVSVAGNTDVNTTASDLQVALAASTHAYFSNVTWSVATDTVTATAGTAGVPFVATSSVTGGTGTIGAVTQTTASAGPAHWGTAANWSGGTVPVSTDTTIIENTSVNICYDLDQNAIDLALLDIRLNYTGKIGLPRNAFMTSADGATSISTATEYRQRYLKIGADAIHYGKDSGIGTSAGSSRIKVDNDKAGASTLTIFDSGSTADGSKPAIQYLAANASADIFVRSCPGGLGVGTDAPDETPTVGNVNVSADNTQTKVHIGNGTTLTNFTQDGGANVLEATATVTKVESNGGTLVTEGSFAVTTMEINAGVVTSNSTGAITALNLKGGTADFLKSNDARTITALNPDGGTLKLDDAVVTVTTWNEPSGRKTVSVS